MTPEEFERYFKDARPGLPQGSGSSSVGPLVFLITLVSAIFAIAALVRLFMG